MFNGVEVPVADQLKYFYDVWGSDQTYHHMAVPLDLGVRHAVLLDQADRVALRRHAPGHGDLVAEGDQGQGRHPQPVPPRHRHRADDPRSDRHPGARRWSTASSRSPIEGVSMMYTFDKANANAPSTHTDAVLRDDGRPRASTTTAGSPAPRSMRPPWDVAGAGQPGSGRLTRGSSTTSRRTGRSPTTSPPSTRTSSRRCRSCSGSRRRSTRSCRSTRRWRPGSSRRGPASPPDAT